jgi:hypothetical protein
MDTDLRREKITSSRKPILFTIPPLLQNRSKDANKHIQLIILLRQEQKKGPVGDYVVEQTGNERGEAVFSSSLFFIFPLVLVPIHNFPQSLFGLLCSFMFKIKERDQLTCLNGGRWGRGEEW